MSFIFIIYSVVWSVYSGLFLVARSPRDREPQIRAKNGLFIRQSVAGVDGGGSRCSLFTMTIASKIVLGA
ncbi:hypothetical protein BC938DRAFT_478646 [Jimgerdemannia flammicorona]|uniref:Uncharacterized protein n=1 Tax=Jimgerdemannia flammicorona TaxID=994334 RepID=A0A433QMK6_9FUNG|nr:hypothetical protein BC938DRAFT_478646 [Jimgerdemannia flammicorona]